MKNFENRKVIRKYIIKRGGRSNLPNFSYLFNWSTEWVEKTDFGQLITMNGQNWTSLAYYHLNSFLAIIIGFDTWKEVGYVLKLNNINHANYSD